MHPTTTSTAPGAPTGQRTTEQPTLASIPLADDPRAMTGGADDACACGDTAASSHATEGSPATRRIIPQRGRTALDLWDALFASYLAARPHGASAIGEAYPETTTGDVRRVAVGLSRQLCLPRYDLADLSATRAAWREADARVTAICRALAWNAPYPENERFWLSDALALAQRLAAVDVRRNSLVESQGGVLTLLGDRSDPLTTWQDLRAYFLARRPIRTERGWRYPETTVGDVAQIARILDEDLRTTTALALPGSDTARALAGRVEPWRVLARDVHTFARRHARDAVYPDNARFWRAAHALAIWMSVGVDVARADAERAATGSSR